MKEEDFFIRMCGLQMWFSPNILNASRKREQGQIVKVQEIPPRKHIASIFTPHQMREPTNP